jgi:hypothetical protein
LAGDLNNHAIAMTCSIEPPDMTHGPERDRPEPLQAQRTLAVATASVSSLSIGRPLFYSFRPDGAL